MGDEKEARTAWAQLASTTARPAGNFYPAMVAHLPEPARRFFRFAIQPGARLASAVEISMEGELSLGTKDNPKPVSHDLRDGSCGRSGCFPNSENDRRKS
jgi:hypothetical protein